MTDLMNLDARKGLPPELRVLVEEYPRDMWTGHANFPGLTAFWLDMHGKFRSVSDELIKSSQGYLDDKTDPQRFGAITARYTQFFLQGLHGHHSVEDHHYFPVMATLDPRVERAFELLDKDHHDLHAHLEQLADATNAVLLPLRDGDDIRDVSAQLLATQERLAAFLERHLTDEEDVVVPLILAHGAERF